MPMYMNGKEIKQTTHLDQFGKPYLTVYYTDGTVEVVSMSDFNQSVKLGITEMTQTINGLEVSQIVRFEKFNRAMVQVIFVDETYLTMSCGDFERQVKRVANPGSVTRFDTDKSDAYNDSMKEGHVGLEATSKQNGLGRWR